MAPVSPILTRFRNGRPKVARWAVHGIPARPFVELRNEMGVLPGIKVDTGAKPLTFEPGEKMTEGLDGLRERIEDHAGPGVTFAKWRPCRGSPGAGGRRRGGGGDPQDARRNVPASVPAVAFPVGVGRHPTRPRPTSAP